MHTRTPQSRTQSRSLQTALRFNSNLTFEKWTKRGMEENASLHKTLRTESIESVSPIRFPHTTTICYFRTSLHTILTMDTLPRYGLTCVFVHDCTVLDCRFQLGFTAIPNIDSNPGVRMALYVCRFASSLEFSLDKLCTPCQMQPLTYCLFFCLLFHVLVLSFCRCCCCMSRYQFPNSPIPQFPNSPIPQCRFGVAGLLFMVFVVFLGGPELRRCARRKRR